jgi:hypothetical protein
MLIILAAIAESRNLGHYMDDYAIARIAFCYASDIARRKVSMICCRRCSLEGEADGSKRSAVLGTRIDRELALASIVG